MGDGPREGRDWGQERAEIGAERGPRLGLKGVLRLGLEDGPRLSSDDLILDYLCVEI